MLQYGLCPKCLELKELTKHHIFPRRFFKKDKRPAILHLCRSCHDKLEMRIPYKEKMYKSEYIAITQEFLNERRKPCYALGVKEV